MLLLYILGIFLYFPRTFLYIPRILLWFSLNFPFLCSLFFLFCAKSWAGLNRYPRPPRTFLKFLGRFLEHLRHFLEFLRHFLEFRKQFLEFLRYFLAFLTNFWYFLRKFLEFLRHFLEISVCTNTPDPYFNGGHSGPCRSGPCKRSYARCRRLSTKKQIWRFRSVQILAPQKEK